MKSLDSLNCSYGELLFRPEWKQKRAQILFRDNYTCQFCGSTNRESLQVHHRQYHFINRLEKFKDPWDYPEECLITICKRCHDRGHAQFKVPNLDSKHMWPFKKKYNLPLADENTMAQPEMETSQISREKFIMENTPNVDSQELPIYNIYKRLQEDWETKGYKDALNFPDSTYRDNQKRVIIDQLRIAIKEALLRYDDKIVDIDMLINQAQKSGLLETYEKYIQEKRKLTTHRDELSAFDVDAEIIGEKTKPILTSYDMGFARGMVSLSNERISAIMAN